MLRIILLIFVAPFLLNGCSTNESIRISFYQNYPDGSYQYLFTDIATVDKNGNFLVRNTQKTKFISSIVDDHKQYGEVETGQIISGNIKPTVWRDSEGNVNGTLYNTSLFVVQTYLEQMNHVQGIEAPQTSSQNTHLVVKLHGNNPSTFDEKSFKINLEVLSQNPINKVVRFFTFGLVG